MGRGNPPSAYAGGRQAPVSQACTLEFEDDNAGQAVPTGIPRWYYYTGNKEEEEEEEGVSAPHLRWACARTQNSEG